MTEIYNAEDELRTLFASVSLGLDVREFISSHPAGKVLITRANSAIMESRAALETVDPCDEAAIRSLQTHALTARNVINWLGTAVQDGSMAEDQLIQRENIDNGEA